MKKQALMVIDVQKGFDSPYWGRRNNPEAEQNIARLLTAWRNHHQPIIHVRHCSTNPNSPLHPNYEGNQFKDEVAPMLGEKQVQKSVNSAFIGTNLEQYLHNQAITALVIVGLTTDHCVSTTTRMAGNLGFQVALISDATATFDRHGPEGKRYRAEEIHAIHLASLNDEFCTVLPTERVIHEVA